MPNHAQMTSSHLVPNVLRNLRVNFDLVPTSSRNKVESYFDLVPPRPENYAQIDLVPTSSLSWDEVNIKISHDFVPLSPLYRGEVGTRWVQ